jgi:hypothetical protein
VSHRIDRAAPFVNLLVGVAHVDDLRVTLQAKHREHDAIAVLRLVEQDKVRIDMRFRLRPHFQVDVRRNRATAAWVSTFIPQPYYAGKQ